MNILSKRLFIAAIMLILLSITNTYAQTESEKIDKLIEQKRAFNMRSKNFTGFKIQIYNGDEGAANKIQRDFDAIFPEYNSTIIYKSPEWKTQIGPFKTRLEADRALLRIKQEYRGSIVIEIKN